MNIRGLMFVCVAILQMATYKCNALRKRGKMRKLEAVQHRRKRIFGIQSTLANGAAAIFSSPSSPSSNSQDCFPASARVSLENGKTIAMSELQPGDRVQTDGVSHNEIRIFLKKQPTVRTMYKSIVTDMNRTISLSGNHLIYGRKSNMDRFLPLYADQIEVNDEVLVQGNDDLTPAIVINVSNFVMQGAFVPLTMNGNIMIDGVLASCHASMNHDLVHLGTAPVRWFPKVMEWIFGDDNGWHNYAKITADLFMVNAYWKQQ